MSDPQTPPPDVPSGSPDVASGPLDADLFANKIGLEPVEPAASKPKQGRISTAFSKLSAVLDREIGSGDKGILDNEAIKSYKKVMIAGFIFSIVAAIASIVCSSIVIGIRNDRPDRDEMYDCEGEVARWNTARNALVALSVLMLARVFFSLYMIYRSSKLHNDIMQAKTGLLCSSLAKRIENGGNVTKSDVSKITSSSTSGRWGIVLHSLIAYSSLELFVTCANAASQVPGEEQCEKGIVYWTNENGDSLNGILYLNIFVNVVTLIWQGARMFRKKE